MSLAARADSASTFKLRLSPVAVFVFASRIALTAAAIAGARSRVGGPNEGVGGTGPGWMRAWTSYDANWYVEIARAGYDRPPTTAFFPVMPMLMRLASPLVGLVTRTDGELSLAISGILISTIAFACALVLIHRETTDAYSQTVADRSILVLALLPFALTWQAVYTESLTLLLLALLWMALRRRQTIPAVAAAIAVGATRSVGIPIGIGLLLAQLGWPFLQRRRPRWDETLAGGAALLSSGAALVWLGREGGGVGAQAYFGRALSCPWVPVWRDLTGVGGYQLGSITSLLAIGVGTAFICARHEPPEWRIAVAVMFLMHLTMARQVPAYTIGAARYLMPMYPVAVWLARYSTRLSRPVLVGCGTLAIATALICAYGAGQGAFNLG